MVVIGIFSSKGKFACSAKQKNPTLELFQTIFQNKTCTNSTFDCWGNDAEETRPDFICCTSPELPSLTGSVSPWIYFPPNLLLNLGSVDNKRCLHSTTHRGHFITPFLKARSAVAQQKSGTAVSAIKENEQVRFLTLGFAISLTVSISSSEIISTKRTIRGRSHSSSCLTGPSRYLGFLFPS